MSTKKTATKKTSSTNVDYDSMKVTELKDLCKERGLSASGLKGEIVKRLKAGLKPSKAKASKSGKAKKTVAKEESEEEVSSSEEVPKKKTKTTSKSKETKKTGKKVKEVVPSDEEASSSEEEVPKKKTKTVSKSKVASKKKAPVKEESSEDNSEDEGDASSSEETPPPKSKKTSSKSKAVPKKKEKVPVKEESSEEESEPEESDQDDDSGGEEPEVVSKKATKKAPVEESEDTSLTEQEDSEGEDEEEPSSSEEVPVPKKSKAAPKKVLDAKAKGKAKVVKKVAVEEDESQDVPAEFLAVLDKDVDHYYVTPQDLLAATLDALKEAGGVPNEKTVTAFALVSESIRKFGLGKKHSVAAAPGKAPVVSGFVKPKPAKVAPPVEEDGSDEPEKSVEDEKDEPKPMTVDFDEKVQAYRLGDYVYNFNDKSVIGKVSGDGSNIVPIVKSDAVKLLDQDIRFVVLGSQAELDSILQENRQSRALRLGDGEDEEEEPEGGDDGKEVPGEDAIGEVENGVKDMVEREAPEITEDKFRRFLEAQVSGQNKADYVAIAKEAGLTDMEGQEIMGNFLAYKDRYAAVAAEAVMKKAPVKTSLGKKAPVANTGRKMIKK